MSENTESSVGQGQRADELERQRYAKGTLAGYAGCLGRIGRWLKNNPPANGIPEIDDDGYPDPTCGGLTVDRIAACMAGLTKLTTSGGSASVSTVVGYMCAIKYAFTSRRMPLPEGLRERLKSIQKGFKRETASKKLTGEIPLTEGKLPITESGYRYFSKYSLLRATRDWELALAAHCHLVVTWNIMARSNETSEIRLGHLNWVGDALELFTCKSKTNQEASDKPPRHIYANPQEPSICPILAIAMLVFHRSVSQPGREANTASLFMNPKSDAARFSTWLVKQLNSMHAEMSDHGIDVSDLGTHSIRKGVASFLSNMIGGPSQVAVWLRAQWSIDIQDVYILPGGEDAFVGRCAAGLDMKSDDFGMLPPHFAPGVPFFEEGESWIDVFPTYEKTPPSFRHCLPFLLASLCYHHDWLRANLPEQHGLFQSAVFQSGIAERLSKSNLIHTGRIENPITRMRASGIPDSVLLRAELRAMRADMALQQQETRKELMSLMHIVQSSKDMVIAAYKADQEKIPKAICDRLMQNFNIEGVQSMSTDQLRSIIEETTRNTCKDRDSRLIEKIEQIHQVSMGRTSEAASLPQPLVATNITNTTTGASTESESTWIPWWNNSLHWGGVMYRTAPQDFEFPRKLNVGNAFRFWHYGDRGKKLRPYKFIRPGDLKTLNERKYLSKMKVVMGKLYDPKTTGREHISSEVQKMFESSFHTLASHIFSHKEGGVPSSVSRYTYNTLHAHINNKRKRALDE